jgi:hypothetical protein
VLNQAKDRLRPGGGRIVVVDFYADHRESALCYVVDQLCWSALTHPRSTVSSITRIGSRNAAAYIRWRVSYGLSRRGRRHIREDLAKGRPMTLAEWTSSFNQALPGGRLTLILGSTFVFAWQGSRPWSC